MANSTLLNVLEGLRMLVTFLMLARVVVSFMPNISTGHPVVRFIYTVTEPILAPFRRILPSTKIGIDLSPMLALMTLEVIYRTLAKML
jgi:YggT family protein